MSKVQAAETPATVTRENREATIDSLREDGFDENHGRVFVVGGNRVVKFCGQSISLDVANEENPAIPADAIMEEGGESTHDRMVNLAKACVLNDLAYDTCMAALSFVALLDPDTITWYEDGLINIDVEAGRYKAIFEEIGELDYLTRPASVEDLMRMLGMA